MSFKLYPNDVFTRFYQYIYKASLIHLWLLLTYIQILNADETDMCKHEMEKL